jgi:hypothetical protein
MSNISNTTRADRARKESVLFADQFPEFLMGPAKTREEAALRRVQPYGAVVDVQEAKAARVSAVVGAKRHEINDQLEWARFMASVLPATPYYRLVKGGIQNGVMFRRQKLVVPGEGVVTDGECANNGVLSGLFLVAHAGEALSVVSHHPARHERSQKIGRSYATLAAIAAAGTVIDTVAHLPDEVAVQHAIWEATFLAATDGVKELAEKIQCRPSIMQLSPDLNRDPDNYTPLVDYATRGGGLSGATGRLLLSTMANM